MDLDYILNLIKRDTCKDCECYAKPLIGNDEKCMIFESCDTLERVEKEFNDILKK